MTLNEFYDHIGGDYQGALSRLLDEDFMKDCLNMFLDDTSFADLQKALEEGETKEAFRFAHTLKGVAQNMGFDRLFKVAFDITEALRADDLEKGRALFPPVEAEYESTIELLKQVL